MTKIFDCVTFFNENFITNLRFEILNEAVDYFVICESIYDHQGKSKNLNFKLENENFKNKIIYLVLDKPFDKKNNPWINQAIQREHILKKLNHVNLEDYIMFSDPDEIPDPKKLKNMNLKKKYGIFLQKMYCYKFNLYNEYESPWEGTRICKKKNLKSINFMRQKVVAKNLRQPFWKFYKEKSIQVFDNGGWHFNSLLKPEDIYMKLKSFAHREFQSDEYSNIDVIKKNIDEKKDLFKRNRFYKKVDLDKSFPEFIIKNRNNLIEWILSS
jgi:beta-1,4-mannosyl-glycoprotein beta-1,4-N-acetylglucosaminyltransferase